jgi:NAD(P)-dependent dehydrogenase (short-subunit alcohol dehydrogenase family)
MGRLQNKTALVIGGGSSGPGWGNGKAAAVLFAREGAQVAVVDVNLAAAEETCAIIRAEGGRGEALAADATKADQVAGVVAEVRRRCGRIDILHNNVGVTVMGDPIDVSEAEWQRALDLNLNSAFLACKHVLPVMLAQKAGAIINISSLASLQINRYPYFGYATAKAALNHFTRALAVHYAPHGIRANAVLPGVMDTPLIYTQIAGAFDSTEAMLAARHAASPMGHMGDAWDVAHAALFLASDDAKYITGVCLPVDGGKSCAGR